MRNNDTTRNRRTDSIVCTIMMLFIGFLTPLSAYEWTRFVALSNVNAIAQENDTLWIGTDVGLIAFTRSDSTYRFWDHVNSGITDPGIEAVAVDTNGIKWLGTKSGLIRFDGRNWELLDHTNSDIPSDVSYARIKSIIVDADNRKWIGTWNGGLVMMADTGTRIFTHANSALPSNAVNCLAIDSSGNIMTGTYGGLGVLQAPEYETIDTSLNPRLPADPIWSIVVAPDGSQWINAAQCFITCGEGGLVHHSEGTVTVYDGNDLSVLSNKVNDMRYGDDGTLWLATNDGMGSWDGAQWRTRGLSGTYIYVVFEDSDGAIWCGTSKTLYQRRSSSWILHSYSGTGLPGNTIWDVMGDSKGNVWFGWSQGLCTYSDGAFEPVNDPVFDGKGVSMLYEDPDGHIWARTQYSRGYSTYYSLVTKDAYGWREFPLDDAGLPSNARVNSILKQQDGTLWIGTSRGVATNPDGVWSVFDTTNSDLPHNNVRDIARDASGNIWIGGGSYRFSENGLVQIIDGGWLVHNANIGLPVDNIYDIEVDAAGDVWAGGQTSPSFNKGGLMHFDGYSWVDTQYVSRSSYVKDIGTGADGSVWAGVYNSVINSDLTWSLIEYNNGEMTFYGPDNSPFRGASINSICFDRQGRQWVVTSGDGVYMRKTGISRAIAAPAERKKRATPVLIEQTEGGSFRITLAAGTNSDVRINAYTLSGRLCARLYSRHTTSSYSLTSKVRTIELTPSAISRKIIGSGIYTVVVHTNRASYSKRIYLE